MDWYFDNIGILFLVGVIVIIFISIISGGKKKTKKNAKIISSIEKKDIKIDVMPLSIEESTKQVEDIKKQVESIHKQVESFGIRVKIQNASKRTIPLAKFRLEELQRHNTNLENGQTPEILESSAMNIIANLEWFVEQEKEYPGAPWLITGGAYEMIGKTRNRYNQMLLKLAESVFNDYKIKIHELVSDDIKTEHTQFVFQTIDCMRGFADTKASNYQQLFNELNNLHFQVEEIFSNTSDKSQSDFDKRELEELKKALCGNKN